MSTTPSASAAAAPGHPLERAIARGALFVGDEAPAGVPAASAGGPGAVVLPASDRAVAGAALGMALAGRPVVWQLVDARALLAAAELIREAGRLAVGGFPLTLVVRVPVGGVPALDDAPLAAIDGAPGVVVAQAADARRAAGLFAHAVGAVGVTVLLEDRALRLTAPAEPSAPEPRVLREGAHVTLAGWGRGVDAALAAAEQLVADGIDAAVLDLEVRAPIPQDALAAQVRRTGRLVVVADVDAASADRARYAAVAGAFLFLESPLAVAPAVPSSIAQAARDAVGY